ncbi:OLC1v1037273C1 [Oldenlandia corymbosa var. corymbosa]|uniref:OLC1v1037273C1 n=1 Tax=Oldenlandia corymbosa var. corymbosa TaxID=529605 RepID=A0AAV1CXC1_OLDCO|nr:OLC1v1037273C1 [Oldenlandia corymbosa var. corymbosa]
MDDSDDERRFSYRSKPAIRNPHPYSISGGHYTNSVGYARQDDFDEEEENPQFNNSPNEFYYQSYYEEEAQRNKKKRKMEPLSSNFELVHRSALNPNLGGSSTGSWNEEGSFVLLEVWGERYLELGRRSLRGEDWVEVAEKVSEMTGVERTELECRNQLDVLKKKYKKERAKMERVGGGFVSNWVFFKKMDVLLNLRMRGHCGLGCGVDSGEYVFMNPRIYLDKSNVLDEMRDSPGVSDEEGDVEDEELERGEEVLDGKSAKLLADSIQRFGEIYEKIESSKRRQMMELEKLRKDFQKEMELQKKEIVERAQAEIAKLREEGEEEEEDDDEEEDEDEDDSEDDDNNADEEDGPKEDIRG